jgi:hypothetical protein
MEHDELLNQIQDKVSEINSEKNIFNAIFYNSNEELSIFIDTMSNEQAIFCLIEACKKSYERGSFNMIESEIVSKSIRILEK